MSSISSTNSSITSALNKSNDFLDTTVRHNKRLIKEVRKDIAYFRKPIILIHIASLFSKMFYTRKILYNDTCRSHELIKNNNTYRIEHTFTQPIQKSHEELEDIKQRLRQFKQEFQEIQALVPDSEIPMLEDIQKAIDTLGVDSKEGKKLDKAFRKRYLTKREFSKSLDGFFNYQCDLKSHLTGYKKDISLLEVRCTELEILCKNKEKALEARKERLRAQGLLTPKLEELLFEIE